MRVDGRAVGYRRNATIGYQNYVSFECGSKGDRAKTLAAAVKLLKEQWEQA